MNQLLIIAIIFAIIALYLWYTQPNSNKKEPFEPFTPKEVEAMEDKFNKDYAEIKKKEAEILKNIEMYEIKQGELETVYETDTKKISTIYSEDKLIEKTNELRNNYNYNLKIIRDKIDDLLKKLNEVRGLK